MMKNLFFLSAVFALSVSFFSKAQAQYQKVWDCNNGAMIIDQYNFSEDSLAYQMVIRDQGVVEYFKAQGFSGNKSSQIGELVADSLKFASSKHNILETFTSLKDLHRHFRLQIHSSDHGSGIYVFADDGVAPADGGHFAGWYFESCQPVAK